jgi:L-methionine (R)-S-oxide reductase
MGHSIDIQKIILKVEQIVGEKNPLNEKLSAISELLKNEVYHYDWVGFYVLDKPTSTLVLGPYIGAKTEHTHIPVGKGVCGQVAQSGTMMVVQDVSQMENYLSCSIDVQSEIVVPIMKNGEFVAELDIDSHSPAPFTNVDQKLLEEICTLLADLF